MIRTAMRCATFVGLVTLSIGCGGSSPLPPTALGPLPAPSPPINPRRDFPAPSGTSRIFAFEREAAHRVTDYTRQSRFVLYANGAFAFQYVSLGLEYRGAYTETGGLFTFEWEGWSTAGPWEASGALHDGVLSVRYNPVMQMTDFEDAVYRLTQ